MQKGELDDRGNENESKQDDNESHAGSIRCDSIRRNSDGRIHDMERNVNGERDPKGKRASRPVPKR